MTEPAVGYVIRMFPQLSETFIANEIREVESRGIPIRIFSCRTNPQHVPHECVQAVRSSTHGLSDPLYRHPRALLSAQVGARSRNPAGHRAALGYAARRSVAERAFDPLKRMLQAAELAQRLKKAPVSCLHAHFARQATDVAMLVSQMTGLRFGFTAHARDIWTSRPERLAEKIRAADWVITCTRANQDHMRGLVDEPDAKKVHLVYHGVDVSKFQPPARPPEPDPPLILSAGRLVPKKGFASMIEACAQLRDRGRRFRYLLVGAGPEQERLEQLVEELRLGDHVEMVGARSQEELALLYQQATLFALPCRILADGDRDGIPNVLVEAMASGLPVVASAISGIPELVTHEQTGLLAGRGTPAEMVEPIERLLDDAALRRRLSQQARLDIEKRFDSETNNAWLAGLFRDELLRIPRS